MADDTIPTLTDSELNTLCGTLLRAMRIDRVVTSGECDTLVDIVAEVLLASRTSGSPDGAYRSAPLSENTRDDVRAAAEGLIERAAADFPDDASLRAALTTVTRPEVQQVIYDAVFSLAAGDAVNPSEQAFLDDLRGAWGLAPEAR